MCKHHVNKSDYSRWILKFGTLSNPCYHLQQADNVDDAAHDYRAITISYSVVIFWNFSQTARRICKLGAKSRKSSRIHRNFLKNMRNYQETFHQNFACITSNHLDEMAPIRGDFYRQVYRSSKLSTVSPLD